MNILLIKANEILEDWVDSRDKNTLDFFNGTTILVHGDGSYFIFRNSNSKKIIINKISFVIVATEHCGYYSFFQEDLEKWIYYPNP
jgi:hypothetical protein